MNVTLKKILFFIVLLLGVHFSLKAQNTNVNTTNYQTTLDSIHLNYKFSHYPQAIKKLAYIWNIAEQEQNKELCLTTKLYLADIYYKSGLTLEAKKLLEKLVRSKDITSSKILYKTKFLYTNTLLRLGETQKAINFYENNLVQFQRENEKIEYLQNFLAGKILMVKNEPNQALEFLNKVELALDKRPVCYWRSQMFYLKAKIFYEQDNFIDAIKYANLGKDYALKNDHSLTVLKFTLLLGEIYNKQGKLSEAYQYSQEANYLQHKIIDFQNSALAIGTIIEGYQISSAESTISKLSTDNLEKDKSIRFNQLGIFFSALFIVILSLFTVSLYRNNNLRAKANELLHKKNQDLIKSNEKVLAATKYREQFLSTITHELRTPIYAVTGLTHLLLNENPTLQQKEHLESLKHSGEHLLSLINNILDINKLESNKVNKASFNFNIHDHLKNTIKTLESAARDNNVKLHIQVDHKIPKRLNGDIVKISQVIINLVANAIKFAKNGNVWIDVKLKEENTENVILKFVVQDDGKGIPKNKHKQIFEKFNQGEDDKTSTFGGTGLGLPIVKSILKFLGSDIRLDSELGKGSRFYFSIEFNKVANEVPLISETSNLDTEKEISEEDYKKIAKEKKILVVEDNKLNQKITCKILEKRNLNCDIANNGKEAVEMVAANNYDVVLMDIHMPVMDGIEATKNIRKTNLQVPIIALTAVSISEELKDFLMYGFNDIIPKPYKTELFYKKIYLALTGTLNND